MMRRLIAVTWLVALDSTLAAAPPESINLRRTVIVDVTERTKDAVVYISTQKVISKRFSPFGDPFFDQFFPNETRYFRAGSLGSGFLIHSDGYIVTNNHVIDRARQIEVELLDGRKLPADLISSNPDADVAILKINPEKPLPALELGDSSDLFVGEPVIAVGNPLGFSHTVSSGIVSALHRDLKDEHDKVLLGDLIQTDAAINPGNSGGPLLNAYGQVIGINTAIRGDAQNIGFAIQVNKLRAMIPDLLNPELVNRLDVPIKLKEQRRLVPPSTVAATIVRADDDAIVATIAGQTPRDIVDAYAILLRQKENEKFAVTFAGKGEKLEVVARAISTPTPEGIVAARNRLGLTVEELTPQVAQKYGVLDDQGMLVTEVARNSVGAKTGIQPGDVIIALGNYPVTSIKQFSNLMRMLPERGRVRIEISRGGQRGRGILQL